MTGQIAAVRSGGLDGPSVVAKSKTWLVAFTIEALSAHAKTVTLSCLPLRTATKEMAQRVADFARRAFAGPQVSTTASRALKGAAGTTATTRAAVGTTPWTPFRGPFASAFAPQCRAAHSGSSYEDQSSSRNGNSGSRNSLFAAVGVAAILGVGYLRTVHADAKPKAVKGSGGGEKEFTLAEVALHKTKEAGIWVTYGDGVYDITKFIDEHPGW